MKSLKFTFLPPVSFHFSVGFKNLVKKIKFKNVLFFPKFSLKDMIPFSKRMIRLIFPLGLRKRFALWLNHQQWLSSHCYLIEGIIRDFMKSNPKAFHKFMWANHIRSYATWYDSVTLFESNKMNGSTRTCYEFFNDLNAVIKDLGLDPSRDIRTVLEVGCSLGHILRLIEKDISPDSTELVGVDIDRKAIDKGTGYLKSVGSKVRLICGDMEELDCLVSNRDFDFIFAAGVISYLDANDATKVVANMLRRAKKIVALVGLASTAGDNRELATSQLSIAHRSQWVHNFEAMLEAAGGRVVRRRWERAESNNNQALYFVFATKATVLPTTENSANDAADTAEDGLVKRGDI